MKLDTSPMNSTTGFLKNHFLLAMPHMEDAYFSRSLVYLIEHSDEGTMGLVVNKPSGLALGDILNQLQPDAECSAAAAELTILNGGPVQGERGFVLHRPFGDFQATLNLGELALTTSQDILLAIAQQPTAADALICLGYAGWGPGQLEEELLANAWLTCPADPDILFNYAADQRLEKAAQSLGIDLNLLTNQAGHG